MAVAEAVASATPGGVATFFIEALQHLALPLTDSGGVDQILVRAIDGDGQLQVAAVSDPHPSGATGYDAVRL